MGKPTGPARRPQKDRQVGPQQGSRPEEGEVSIRREISRTNPQFGGPAYDVVKGTLRQYPYQNKTGGSSGPRSEPSVPSALVPAKPDKSSEASGQSVSERPYKPIDGDNTDWDFIANGAWWSRPPYQRAVLLVLVSPLYRLRGYLYMAHQAAALRAPYFPYGPASARARMAEHPKSPASRLARFFTPPGWVHEYPCSDPWPHQHDEEHQGGDGCSALAHGICWEHQLDIGYAAGDTFDLRFDRAYTLNFSDGAKSAQKLGETQATADAGQAADSPAKALSEAPGGLSGPNIGPGAGRNEHS